jgi:Tfp pilus assembly protein PilF
MDTGKQEESMDDAFRRHARGCAGLALALLVFSLSAALRCAAQSGAGVDVTGTGGIHTVQGRIYLPSGKHPDSRIKVRLESTNAGELSVLADVNGAFSFRSLQPGSYTIVVDAGADYEVSRESIYIERDRGRLTAPRIIAVPIYLQPKRAIKSNSRPGVVDATPAIVPAAAQDLYNRALESAAVGDHKKAVEELQAAISRHPEFPLALNELGVQLLKLGRADKAADALRAALKIAPDEFMPRLNYGIALLQQRKFTDAEKELRTALARNDSSPVARLYLGIVLASLHKYDESEAQLQRAAGSGRNDVALAHYYLGGLYWRKREYSRAADELEKYLKSVPEAADAERVRSTIRELRNRQ